MTKNDRRSVVERCIVISKAMDHARQGRVDRQSSLHEQIDPEVDRSPLRTLIRLCAEQWSGVNAARLVVSADTHVRAGIFKSAKQNPGGRLDVGKLITGSEFEASDAEVEHDRALSRNISFDNACTA